MKKLYLGVLFIGLMGSCSLTRPYAVTNNTLGSKTGVSETGVILGTSYANDLAVGLFVTNKDFGVIEAAKNGNINKIGSVDVKKTSYLGIFTKVEIIVTGE